MALFGARDATKGKPAGGTHRLSGLINTPLVAQFYLLCGEYSYALFLEDVTEFAQQEDGVMTLEEAFRFLEQMA
eukprot:8498342-Pyramimonas_sp.AAC.1